MQKQNNINQDDKDIFDRMRSGDPIRLDDPQYPKVLAIVNRTIRLNAKLNTSEDVEQIRKHLSEIVGSGIDSSTIVFAPFYTNFGQFITIGKNVFINHACSFLDMGGITIEDNVINRPESKSDYRESSTKSK